MVNKVKEIVSGYKNYFIESKEVSRFAKARAEICASCQEAKKGAFLCFARDLTYKEIQGYYCGVCKCPLSVKVRSNETSCPLKKWSNVI